MGKILKEKVINTELFTRDNAINFVQKNEVNLINLESAYNNKPIFEIEELSVSKDTINANFYNQVVNIFNKANDIFNDKGINTLFAAYDFVHYKWQDKTSTTNTEVQSYESPLFFFPIKLSFIKEGTIGIEIIKKPLINRKLFNFLKDIAGLELVDLPEEMDMTAFRGLMFNTFVAIKRSEAYPGLYLGNFDPFEKKLKLEIREIANMDIDLYDAKPIYSKNEYINQEFEEEPLLIINNPLNIYQKIAVRSALNENTIIYGPPGTGKSEIIVNIMANALVNEKSLLVTCEKKTALDVLLERLGDIKKMCLFLNSIDDEDLVYKKVVDIQENLGLTWWIHNEQDSIKDQTSENTRSISSPKLSSLRNDIYELNSIKAFSKRTIEFYKKIKDSINLDFISKTALDFSSYQNENKVLLNEMTRIDGWDELVDYKNKYFGVDESIWTLVRKIFYYDQFKSKYMLDDFKVNEYFEKIDELHSIRNRSLFADDLETIKEDFEQRYIEFVNLVEIMNLKNDNEFYIHLAKDYSLFEKQMKTMMKIYESYGHILVEDPNFLNFLINNSTKHCEFISQINNTPEYFRFTALDIYLTTSQIYPKKIKIKKFQEQQMNLLKEKYEIISLFAAMVLPQQCSYLLRNPYEIWHYLTSDIVFTYIDEKMKSEEVTYLMKNEMIRADKRICDIVTKSAIKNYIKRVEKLSEFEEINIKNKEFSDKIMNSYIVQFYKENTSNIETISTNIYTKYIEWIRKRMTYMDEDFKKKAIEMFQVAKVPSGKNRMKITTFIKRYNDILKTIFPIWIGSPTDVSNYCRFERNIFDIAIIDESSQMLMENALPVLYRAKHYVVAGDDKQLKATVAFSKKYKNDNRLDYQDKMDFDIVESLLDRANVALWNGFTLRNHYRSEKQELIAFSNEFIYDNQLIFATKNHKNEKAIEVINVKDGFYVDSINKKEAEEVIRILSKVVDNKEYDSFLVITFSANQADYIEKLIIQSNFAAKFTELINQNKLRVRNLENTQGFEADCVILSVSHGRKDEESKLKSSFGPLIQDGGMNRLNVAITRAKSKMYVVKSLYASEMSINKENKNLMVFYNFINYLDNIEDHYQSIINVKRNKVTKYRYGNEIIDYITKKLTNKEINFTTNHMLGNFMADIVFYTKDLNNVELVICLDYWSKYNEAFDLLISINTQEYLMGIGYDFIRIKELEWQFNKEEVIKNLDSAILKIIERLDNRESVSKKEPTKLKKAKTSATKSKTSKTTKTKTKKKTSKNKPKNAKKRSK